jgi:hypothetical protein
MDNTTNGSKERKFSSTTEKEVIGKLIGETEQKLLGNIIYERFYQRQVADKKSDMRVLGEVQRSIRNQSDFLDFLYELAGNNKSEA